MTVETNSLANLYSIFICHNFFVYLTFTTIFKIDSAERHELSLITENKHIL